MGVRDDHYWPCSEKEDCMCNASRHKVLKQDQNWGDGGEGGIRTPGGRKSSTVFETAPIGHSGTSPWGHIGYLFLSVLSRVLGFEMWEISLPKQVRDRDDGTARRSPVGERSKRPERYAPQEHVNPGTVFATAPIGRKNPYLPPVWLSCFCLPALCLPAFPRSCIMDMK